MGLRGLRGPTGNLPRPIILSFIAVVAVATAVLVLLVWQVTVTSHLAEDGQEARDALCIFRADLERRYRDGQKFLRENPEGIPGIDASVIRNSLKNQKATIKSLADLDCKPRRVESR
jgi:hypothetical protein